MSIYRGMFEACAVTVDLDGEPSSPYYSKDEMDTYIDEYFKDNLSKYVSSYTVEYSFLNADGNICSLNCNRIQIHLTADINTFYKYDKTQTFLIVDGDTL